MPRLANAARSAGTHAHALLCLLVLLTLLRGFIPAGYMPDPQALSQGRFALMPCPAAAGAPVSAPTSGMHAQHPTHDMSPAIQASHGDHAMHAPAVHDAHSTHDALVHDGHATPAAPVHAAHTMHAAPVQDTHGSAHADASLDCPFSLLTHVTADIARPLTLDALPGLFTAAVAHPVSQSRPPLPAAGPPLGSRAPPLRQI